MTKKIYLALIMLTLSLTLTGCDYRDVLCYVHEAFKSDYLMDADLESATWKNSAEPDAIKGDRALDATREKYASSFNKKIYFDEIGESEDKGYVYFNKNTNTYLALNGMINLEGEDFYEIIMFTYDNEEDIYDNSKTIIESYYVNIKTLEIYSSGNKPVETYKLRDDTYGFELSLPKEYEENYMTFYLEPSVITIADKETNVRTISVSYREGNVSNDLFDIICFEGDFKASDFNTSKDAYFLGSNDTYSICLVASQIEDSYLTSSRKIIEENFEMIAEKAKLFDVKKEETKTETKTEANKETKK